MDIVAIVERAEQRDVMATWLCFEEARDACTTQRLQYVELGGRASRKVIQRWSGEFQTGALELEANVIRVKTTCPIYNEKISGGFPIVLVGCIGRHRELFEF